MLHGHYECYWELNYVQTKYSGCQGILELGYLDGEFQNLQMGPPLEHIYFNVEMPLARKLIEHFMK